MLWIGLWSSPARIVYEVSGMLLGMVHRYLPMMVLPIATSVAKTPTELWRASINLGASPARTFFRVEMPLSLPGIVAGCQLVFASVLSDFVLPTLMGTTRLKMLAPAIYEEAVGRMSWATAGTMACLSLALLAVLLLATTALMRRLAPWARTL
jgi:ABC-type spermidine/putrescine transport system permease subunit I